MKDIGAWCCTLGVAAAAGTWLMSHEQWTVPHAVRLAFPDHHVAFHDDDFSSDEFAADSVFAPVDSADSTAVDAPPFRPAARLESVATTSVPAPLDPQRNDSPEPDFLAPDEAAKVHETRESPAFEPIAAPAESAYEPVAYLPPEDLVEASTNPIRFVSDRPAERTGSGESKGWTATDKSTGGRPLHTRSMGTGPFSVVVIAGMDGADRASVRFVDELASDLAKQSQWLRDHKIVLIRAANPDGLTALKPTNSRGVLIDRNFPSRLFQVRPEAKTGEHPASELETRVMLKWLHSTAPNRVVLLRSTSGSSSLKFNREVVDPALELEERFQIPARRMEIELEPGSLEDYVTGTLQCEMLTLSLTLGDDWKTAGARHLPLLQAAVTHVAPRSTPAPTSSDELVSSFTVVPDVRETGFRDPVPPKGDEPVRRRPERRRGYEELAPPPQ